MKKILAIITVLAMVFCFVGCGNTAKIIVAEKESAGEEVAKELDGYEYTAVDTQAKAIMEVASGTADAAIIDYVTSIGSIGKGTDYENVVIDGEGYEPENYGIAFRKGSDVTAKVNEAIATLKENGKLNEIAKKYKLDELILANDKFDAFKQSEKDSDWEYIKNKGELVGFETEFAKAVCEVLGVNAKFQEINWSAKETELASKNIDCIWNGMTITEERSEAMSITIPYMQNKQVMVVKEK